MELWTALAIGFLGSFHCVGMCGPIALALPGSPDMGLPRFVGGRVLYNLGRVITYTLLGGIFGLIGGGVTLAGLQQPLSILLGILILAGAFFPTRFGNNFFKALGLEAIFSRLRSPMSRLMSKPGLLPLFGIGLINGMLPCGFVYMGIAGSLTMPNIFQGMLYMTLFGLGTFPAMMILASARRIVSMKMRRRINRWLPWFAAALGILFILRGLSLNIPFLSPVLSMGGM